MGATRQALTRWRRQKWPATVACAFYVVDLGSVGDTGAMPEGMPIYLQLDEPTMREVARMTGGEYHHAGTAEALRSVYENLGSRVQVQTRETEVSALLALLSAGFAFAAGVLSMVWFRRLV